MMINPCQPWILHPIRILPQAKKEKLNRYNYQFSNNKRTTSLFYFISVQMDRSQKTVQLWFSHAEIIFGTKPRSLRSTENQKGRFLQGTDAFSIPQILDPNMIFAWL